MSNRFELEFLALTRTDQVLRHFEAMRVTAIQIGAKNFKLIHLGSKGTQLGWGKEEFCLTKLRARRATSSTFAALRLLGVLNAFGLFARAARSSCSTNIESGLTSTRAGASTFHRGTRRR